jgi:methyltransferase (TIGR00027 family)
MNILSKVSETALITLKARAVEAGKSNPLIIDEKGIELLKKLKALLPAETRKRILDRKMPGSLSCHIALRARKYDAYARDFLRDNPEGLVVSLGCGFDTRFWRLSADPARYIEIDLPPVVAIKKELLGVTDTAPYRMISASVLDKGWMEGIEQIQDQNILFLAEGLLMYLPKPEVIKLFNRLSCFFSRSQIVFEVVNDMYTRGIWKKMVKAKMKRALGCEAGSSYESGLRNASEVESYGSGIKVTDEWSYLEEKEVRPAVLKLFRNCRFMNRTQWTIKASIA